MADETKEPRRYKMPSEYTDDGRAVRARFGGGEIRPERDEYSEWRREMLSDGRDDLGLRGRLLGEQAEALRVRAATERTDALEAMTTEEHHAHLAAVQKAREAGVEAPKAVDAGASKLDQQADELEAEAQEIHDHLAMEAI